MSPISIIMRFKWLFLVDLDGTVWDHKDISSLQPPFKKISEDTIIDSQGTRVTLHKDILELIKWARNKEALVSTLSWNNPIIAYKALKTFGILDLFHTLAIEDTPRKDKVIEKLLNRLKDTLEIKFKPSQIAYIDDRDIHITDIRRNIGDILFLHYSKDIHTFNEAKEKIEEWLDKHVKYLD